MTTRTYRIVCGLVVALLIFILPYTYVLSVMYFRKPSVYRLPFPAEGLLTEQHALELTKQALILDGKRSDAMHPVLSGHKDADGREVFFCATGGNSDEGFVLWWLERRDHVWEYSVGITREGDEVICTITKPL